MLKMNVVIGALCALSVVYASCPNKCNSQGVCDKFSRCTCATGFQGADCSERICPFSAAWADEASATDTAHASAECSNRGICDRETGKCDCMDGFTGSACERLDCALGCNEKGICFTMKDFAHRTRSSDSESLSYESIWDANKIKGCKCDNLHYSYDCGLRECPDGDDPLTTGQVNEIQLIKCTATQGSFTLYYDGVPSPAIRASANAAAVKAALLTIPALTDVKVSFSQVHGTACQIQTNVISVEFIEQFGDLNPLVPVGDATLTANGGSITMTTGGISLTDAMGHVVTSQTGTKEAETCANRGTCDSNSGICSCYISNGDIYGSSDGYGQAGTRGDCGHIVSSTSATGVSACPGDIACSGHGVCDEETHRCACSYGWSAGDCSEMTCPKGLSWFSYPTADEQAHDDYVECANMGHCDTTNGRCVCRSGFYGEACEYMACGGSGDTTDGATPTVSCSGHGRCMSMAELALWANNNGDATDYVYGSDPNNPATWDKDRVHGCLCDTGFSGYDCSLKDCPVGDDPGTYEDHVEVQMLQCTADAGNFTLSFRQSVTPPLPFDINAVELQAALAALDTILNVNVYFIYEGLPPNGTLNFVPPSKTQTEGTPPWGHFKPNGRFEEFEYVEPERAEANTSFCMVDSTQIAIISFDYTHGDLPALQVDNTNLFDFSNFNGEFHSGVINVFQDGASVMGLGSIKGTTETDVCSNRGLCDTSTGLCHCFEDWTSSAGARQGPAGNTGDCGYRNDKQYSWFESQKSIV